MRYETSDLCDLHADRVRVAAPGLLSFGALRCFHGEVSTVQVYRDFALVRDVLGEPGGSRVLVVDAAGYAGGAMLGGNMAARAATNCWAGVVVNGYVRDVAEIRAIALGILALGAVPARGAMHGDGQRDVQVQFAGVRFSPGDHVYVDEDGLIVSDEALPGTD